MKYTFTAPLALFALGVAALTSGCATGTDGVVPMGGDLYMVGGLGQVTDYSSTAVKGRLYKDASKHCMDMNRVMLPENSTGQDSGLGTYASAEIQFRCLLPSDPRIPK